MKKHFKNTKKCFHEDSETSSSSDEDNYHKKSQHNDCHQSQHNDCHKSQHNDCHKSQHNDCRVDCHKMPQHNDYRDDCHKKSQYDDYQVDCHKTNCKSIDYVINLCDKVERRRDIHNWKVKTVQFLESTGMQKVCEPNKLILHKVTVAGPTKELDITDIIKIGNNQIGKCPVECIYIDTGKLNEYGNCDVEPGYRKLVQIEYLTDTCIQQQKKVCVTKDEIVDCGVKKYSCVDKKRKHKKRCKGCDRHPNHCECRVRPFCNKCNKHECVCSHQLCNKCNKRECACSDQFCNKCNNHYNRCECKVQQYCNKCNRHKCVCRSCPNIRMSNMLYIPLYPIARPYMCANPKFCKCVGKCGC